MMKLSFLSKMAVLAVATAAAAVAVAQTGADTPTLDLNIPADPQFFGSDDPTVRKATAIVNGDIITGTDVDQRLALIVIANGGKVAPEELQRLREQVLRNLVDETLQIQAAEAQDIKIEQKEIDAYYEQYARNLGQSPVQFNEYLKQNGSSDRSIKRQIHGEIAWRRVQGREIEPFVNVADEE